MAITANVYHFLCFLILAEKVIQMGVSPDNKVSQGEQLNIDRITWEDFVWTNIVNPSKREMDYLAQHFPFHRLDLEDCLSLKQRPKIDEYPDYLFLIFHYSVFNRDTRVSSHAQVAVFIGEKYLVTVHSGGLKTVNKFFRECQSDEEVRKKNFSQGSGFILYRILDQAVDNYFPVLDKLLSLTDDVEDKVFDENIEIAQELAILRRDIVTQRRIMFPSRTILAQLESRLKRFIHMDISVYYGDLMDHFNKICETLDEIKEIIEIYKDADFILSTDRLNRVMRGLTILSTIILPFLVVSSMYGMNIVLPGGLEGQSGSVLTFIILIVVMFAIGAGMLMYFRYKRWI